MLTVNQRDKVEWREGMTVQDLLGAMGFTYALITVTVNGAVVDHDDYAAFRIPDGAEVGVFHLAHGG
ncbi:MAG: sulfur carrier protein ThiS [Candidatus Eisenbacteria bacterium]|nr:sulfur carrier protein ThiS [Candidatus Eisenbacteria bacterium]